MDKQRLKELDVFKGVSILLILLLHSLCRYPINLHDAQSLQWINSFISFSSPLACFFFASGFLFSKSRNKNNLEFIKDKAIRLLIPFFFFSLLKVSLKFVASGYVRTPLSSFYQSFVGIFFGENYWFLYSLFLIFVINKFAGKYNILVAIILLVLNLTGLLSVDILTIDKTTYYNFFFVLGSIIGENRNKYNCFKNFVLRNRLFFVFISVVVLICGTLICNEIQPSYIFLSRLIISCISILFIWIFSICLEDNKLLTHFGVYCFQYYLNHLCIILGCFYLAAFVFSKFNSYHISLLVVFVTTILLSRLMLSFEKKCSRLKILFGL